LTNIYQTDDIRQMPLWGPQVAGGLLGSWGPRLKPT